MKKVKNVLVCPLDWGLGHATRCIPVINELLNQNANVLIAGDGDGLELLKKEFPQLTFLFLKGYRAKYQSGNMALAMLKQLPRFLATIVREYFQIKKIIRQHNIDIVISDNRYGLWNKKIKSVFITHQVNIQTPQHLKITKPIINGINRFFINQFFECWIPDTEGENNLSGKLSDASEIKIPVYKIGLLSRFASLTLLNYKPQTTNNKLLCILSGPEPQRTIFEGMLIEQLQKLNISVLIIRGRPNDNQELKSKFLIEFKNHASAHEMFQHITNAEIVIARAGYSTIMDLATLGKKAILIPTPGQTEQEYLAGYFFDKKIFYTQQQHELNLQTALKEVEGFNGIKTTIETTALQNQISKLIASQT